jgi:UDP-glucose 4-epimerase
MALFRSKNILITGGIGFIGSNLAKRLLREGANITLVDSMLPQYGGNFRNIEPIRQSVNVNISDVRDRHSLPRLLEGVDYIFNLAGQSSHLDSMIDPFTDLEINTKAQLSILEACRVHNPAARIVFASTRQVYGKPEYLPVDEAHPVSPVDVNGINKISGEQYHLLYAKVYGLKTTILRLTNTYGPGMRIKDARQTFLGVWVRQLLNRDPITVYGDGSQLRDFNYVDDCVDAMIRVSLNEGAIGEIFNLGDENCYSLTQVAGSLIKLTPGSRLTYKEFPNDLATIDIGDYYANYAKITAITGWVPQTSLTDGLSKTISYFSENFKYYL